MGADVQLGAIFYTFPVELLCAVLLFCVHVRWRMPRVGAAVLLGIVTVGGFIYAPLVRPFDGYDEIFPWIIRMVGFFGLCAGALVAVLHQCAELRWIESLVIVAAGYSVQHVAFDVCQLFCFAFWPASMPQIGLEYLGVVVATYAVVYGMAYWLCCRRFVIDGDRVMRRIAWLLISIGVIVLVIVFNLVFVQHRAAGTQLTGYVYDIVCVSLALSVMMLVSVNDHLHDDLLLIRETDRLRDQHYELAKESIELINIKCHDIRRIIASASEGGGRLDAEAMRDMENDIRVYDSMFRTGNKSLDTLLTEKSLYCSKNGIMFVCSADGRRLDFLARSDLYSLFGNLLDNAVESVAQVREPDKRVIDLSVSVKGGLLFIEERNYYAADKQPSFRNGLPVSTKQDRRYHGFGVRSIARQVRRYGGELSMTAEHERFSVSIVIPIPSSAADS